MTLSNTLKAGIVAAGVGLTGLTGCEVTPEGKSLLEQLYWQGTAASLREKGKPNQARIFENLGFIRGNIEAAKAGKSEVNIYTGTNENKRPRQTIIGYNDPSIRVIRKYVKQSIVDDNFKNSTVIPEGRFYGFVANYWKDFNGDGKSNPNEYVGIKKRFRENEELILVWYSTRSGLKGSKIVSEIYSPNGNLIDTDEFTNKFNTGRAFYHREHSEEDKDGKLIGMKSRLDDGGSLMNFLVEKSGYGNYKVVWKLDGKYDGSTEFEIIPSLRNKEATQKD